MGPVPILEQINVSKKIKWIDRLSLVSLITPGAAGWNLPPKLLSLTMRKSSPKGVLPKEEEGIWGMQKLQHAYPLWFRYCQKVGSVRKPEEGIFSNKYKTLHISKKLALKS